jgi:hypothetical protein
VGVFFRLNSEGIYVEARPILRRRLLCLTILTGLVLFGCKGPEPRDLPFETIESADLLGPGEYSEEETPKIIIITELEQVDDRVGDAVSPQAQAQLRDLDFDRYFVVGVFQGRRPYIYWASGVEIQRIEQRGDTITILAHFYEPIEDQVRGGMAAPYQLLRIRKGGSIRGEFNFILKVNGQEIVRKNDFIP